MTLKTLILTPAFFFTLHILTAQNISGLEVPVSKDKLSSLTFHSDITNYFKSDKKSPYNISTLGNNALMIQVSQEVKDPCTLTVMEGGRRHEFILIYKDDIDLSDQDKDFSDLKELDKLVKNMPVAAAKDNTVPAPNASKNDQKANAPVTNTSTVPVNNGTKDNFYALLDSADKAKSAGRLQDARARYEQLLQMKPDNTYVQAQLKEVNKTIAEASTAKYSDLIIKANNAFSSDKYEEALKAYNDALNIKPDAAYAISQINVIRKKQEADKIEESNRQKDSSFNTYISTGDKALSEKSYDVAAVAYNEALNIKPGNIIATSKINSLKQAIYADSVIANRKANDDLYTSFLNIGIKALQEKSYESARLNFNEALKVKPGDATATSKLNLIDQQIVADSLQAVRNKTKTLYDTYIQYGDKAFNAKLYDVAKNNYSEALEVNPEDTYAKNQIKKIDAALEQIKTEAQKTIEAQKNAENEKQYKDLIAVADNYYNSGMLSEAKNEYQKALDLNPKDVYSKNKISQIENLVVKQKQQLKEDSVTDAKYTALIIKADENFNNQNYTAAKTSYSNALIYKPEDQYSKDRLGQIAVAQQGMVLRDKTIADSITRNNEISKQYNTLITKANAAYDKDDYIMAKGLYSSASELKPDEEMPKNKMAEIDFALSKIALQKEQAVMCDSLVTAADIMLIDSDYNVALETYKKALALNQEDKVYYINKQISFVQKQIEQQESISAQTKKEEDQQKKVEELKSIFNQAMDSINNKNYAGALTYFTQYVNTASNLGFEPQDYDVAKLINFAQKKIVAINDEFKRQQTRDTTTYKLPDIKSLPSRIIIVYPIPKDPKLDAIYEKYPDIEFHRPPDDQPFDSISDYGIANMLISKEFMSAQALSIAENSNNGIKLTCENIFFKGPKMYIKLMLQNSASEEFLTGRMLLTEKKQDGSVIRILPNYVAGYPIILPNQQKIIVYVTKTKELSDNDSLHFEVSDRLNKVKIEIDIPGNIYNGELKKAK